MCDLIKKETKGGGLGGGVLGGARGRGSGRANLGGGGVQVGRFGGEADSGGTAHAPKDKRWSITGQSHTAQALTGQGSG